MIRAVYAQSPIVPVKRLVNYISRRFNEDPKLQRIGVRGEVTNFKPHPRGFVHFDLKEGEVVLQCYVSPNVAQSLPPIGRGDEIVAFGRLATYEARSAYQLEVRYVETSGSVGELHAVYEERRKRLEHEGLFRAERKRTMPRYPFRIALVSSPRAEGLRDVRTILERDAPHIELVYCDTAVQGPQAGPEIARAIERASRMDVDLIAVVRGGGSYEELFAFSAEEVVRAIVAARHPVLTAIGHDSDRTLADFAADVSAPTPSAAAKLFVSRVLLLEAVVRARGGIERCVERRLRDGSRELDRLRARGSLADSSRIFRAPLVLTVRARERLAATSSSAIDRRLRRLRAAEQRLARRDPSSQLAQRQARLGVLAYRLRVLESTMLELAGVRATERRSRLETAAAARHASRSNVVRSTTERLLAARFASFICATESHERLTARAGHAVRATVERSARGYDGVRYRLHAYDPEIPLRRGYAFVEYGGKMVRDAADVPIGATIDARVAHGTLHARVERRSSDGNE